MQPEQRSNVAADGSYVGCILIADEVKPDSNRAIAELKKIGVEKTVMLTGNDERIGKSVADELGLDAYYAQLLPDQKVEKLEMLDKQKRQGSKLAFVGDGINDALFLPVQMSHCHGRSWLGCRD